MRPAALFVLLLATTTNAATLVVTNETPLSSPSIGSETGGQFSPSIAWDGHSLAAIWFDSSIRIAQLDSFGRPKGPAARLASSMPRARIAANGRTPPLVAIQDRGQVIWIGTAGSTTQGVPGYGYLDDLISNGNSYLLLYSDPYELRGMILDDRGFTRTTAKISKGAGGFSPVAFAFGDTYHVIYSDWLCDTACDWAIRDAVIHEDGTFDVSTLVHHVPRNAAVAATAAGQRILIAWTTSESVEFLEMKSGQSFLASSSIGAEANELLLSSDGSDFLLSWSTNHALHSAPIDATTLAFGPVFDLQPSGWGIRSARTPDGVVLAWSDGDNVYTRSAPTVRALVDASSVLASLGVTEQQDLSMKGVPVWIEGDGRNAVVMAAGTVATTPAGRKSYSPVAARGAGATIVVWRDRADSGYERILAQVNDQPPMFIGDGGYYNTSADVVFDGASFLVAWSNGSVYQTRILPTGVRLDTTEIPSFRNANRVTIEVSRDRKAIAFDDWSMFWVYDGTSTIPLAPIDSSHGPLSKPALAFSDSNEPVVAFTDFFNGKNCIYTARRLTADSSSAQPLYCTTAQLSSPANAWNGSEFVIAWDELAMPGGDRLLRLLRAKGNGDLLDGPFTVGQGFAPSLTPSPSGVVLGYQRIADEEPFDGARRVFMRTVLRGGSERVRSVGH